GSSCARVSMSARSASEAGSCCTTAAVVDTGWSVSRNACRCGGGVACASARTIARSSSAEHVVSRCSTASQNAFNESLVSIGIPILPTRRPFTPVHLERHASPPQGAHDRSVRLHRLEPLPCLKTRGVHTMLLLLAAQPNPGQLLPYART